MTATGLDFYHLGENVHKARRVISGGECRGKQWAGALLHTAKHEGYGPLWERLLELRKETRGPARRKAADRLLNYVSDRREMIRYPEFLAHGWQIGSGRWRASAGWYRIASKAPASGGTRTMPRR